MKLYDNFNLFAELLAAAEINRKEKCALAVGSMNQLFDDCDCIIDDYCFADSIGGESKMYLSTVPCEFSVALMALCKKTGQIPIIIHTHPLIPEKADVCFSDQDVKFIKSFAWTAQKQGIDKTVFVVTDGIGMESCIADGMAENYLYERGVLDEKVKTG